MTRSRGRGTLIVLILGALSTVSPFSIDMYLPAFPEIARDLGTTPSQISLSVSGYFIGLAIGQLFYGPLLDRFGRKPPLYIGLSLFALASLGCVTAPTAGIFVGFRLLQAMGGCAAQVGAVTMVRDFFPVEESAKILSLLMLVLSVSPLFAPTIGGFIAATAGWRWIFIVLAGFALVVMVLVATLLPAARQADPQMSLRPRAILSGFAGVIGVRQFAVYAISGSFSFAALFVYVTGSPIIFIATFHVEPHTYGLIFAALGASFIGGSQFNIWLSRRVPGAIIFRNALIGQNVMMLIMVTGSALGAFGLAAHVILLMLYLPFCGAGFPNAAALALAPFNKNVGSAAALLGFLQMGIGAIASTGVGLLHASSSLPIFAVMATTSLIGLVVLLLGQRGTERSRA
jgi:DHA1 family bicyclomycin/chloramphenicol resistance-like MFS transporter